MSLPREERRSKSMEGGGQGGGGGGGGGGTAGRAAVSRSKTYDPPARGGRSVVGRRPAPAPPPPALGRPVTGNRQSTTHVRTSLAPAPVRAPTRAGAFTVGEFGSLGTSPQRSAPRSQPPARPPHHQPSFGLDSAASVPGTTNPEPLTRSFAGSLLLSQHPSFVLEPGKPPPDPRVLQTRMRDLEAELALLDEMMSLEKQRADDEAQKGDQARDELLAARQQMRTAQEEADQQQQRAQHAEEECEVLKAQVQTLGEKEAKAMRRQRELDAFADELSMREKQIAEQEADAVLERERIAELHTERALQREGSILNRKALEDALEEARKNTLGLRKAAIAMRWRWAAASARALRIKEGIESQGQLQDAYAEVVALRARLAASEEARVEAEREAEQLQGRYEEQNTQVAELQRAVEDLGAARATVNAALAERREVRLERAAVEAARRQLEADWDGESVVDELLASAHREATLAEKAERLQRRVGQLEEAAEQHGLPLTSAAGAAAAAVGRWRLMHSNQTHKTQASTQDNGRDTPTSGRGDSFSPVSEKSANGSANVSFVSVERGGGVKTEGELEQIAQGWALRRRTSLMPSFSQAAADAARGTNAFRVNCACFVQAAIVASRKEVRLVQAKLEVAEAKCREAEEQTRMLNQRNPHEPKKERQRTIPVGRRASFQTGSQASSPGRCDTSGGGGSGGQQCERLQARLAEAQLQLTRDAVAASRMAASFRDAQAQAAEAELRLCEMTTERDRAEQRLREVSRRDATQALLRARLRNDLQSPRGGAPWNPHSVFTEAARIEEDLAKVQQGGQGCGRCEIDGAKNRMLRAVCESVLALLVSLNPQSPALQAAAERLAMLLKGCVSPGRPPVGVASGQKELRGRSEQLCSVFAVSPTCGESPSPSCRPLRLWSPQQGDQLGQSGEADMEAAVPSPTTDHTPSQRRDRPSFVTPADCTRSPTPPRRDLSHGSSSPSPPLHTPAPATLTVSQPAQSSFVTPGGEVSNDSCVVC
eukprot:Hpha_TRINITY_DN22735_c0_g1::TRINITY_DN22735_c0_g1_i1::g.34237::m.34237